MPCKQCQIPGCGTQYNDAKLFAFPRNEWRARRWLNAIKSHELSKFPIELMWTKKICSKHFTPDCFTSASQERLSVLAVPTLELPAPSDLFQPIDSPPTTPKQFKYQRKTVTAVPTLELLTPSDGSIDSSSRTPILFEYKPKTQENLPRSLFNALNIDDVTYNDLLNVFSEEDFKEEDVDKRCRICLVESENAIPLSHSTNINGEESQTLCEIINKCTNAEIAIDDDKPQTLCIDCVEMTRIAYQFYTRREKSELILKEEAERARKEESESVSCLIILTEYDDIEDLKELIKNTTQDEPAVENPEKPINSTLKTVTHYKKRAPVIKAKCKNGKSVKTIVCANCCKNYNKHVPFKCYKRVLIGKKRYQCLTCGARFSNARNLIVHKALHNKPSWKMLPNLLLM